MRKLAQNEVNKTELRIGKVPPYNANQKKAMKWGKGWVGEGSGGTKRSRGKNGRSWG